MKDYLSDTTSPAERKAYNEGFKLGKAEGIAVMSELLEIAEHKGAMKTNAIWAELAQDSPITEHEFLHANKRLEEYLSSFIKHKMSKQDWEKEIDSMHEEGIDPKPFIRSLLASEREAHRKELKEAAEAGQIDGHADGYAAGLAEGEKRAMAKKKTFNF